VFRRYRDEHPVLATEFQRRIAGRLPEGWDEHCARTLEGTVQKGETLATRKASQNALEALGPLLPELLGGSADLSGSNLTLWSGSRPVRPHSEPSSGGNYIFYGVRELGMCAVMNGLALHGGFIPYGGTFLTFSDYARNALRMAALMRIGPILVFSHDSIGLGEDGPTHQPVEHAASLRLIPNLDVWRPADSAETLAAWTHAVERSSAPPEARGPSALLLSRQNVPFLQREKPSMADMRRGGYIVADALQPRAVIIATGSEVQLALGAARLLGGEGVPVRVVSMPSTSVFDRQDVAYRNGVLSNGSQSRIPRVAVEAGVTDGWRKYVGLDGAVVGLDRFGESAPAGDLFRYFGLTAEAVARAVRDLL
jgi:transketolase